MTGNTKLDMSLDALIKKQRKPGGDGKKPVPAKKPLPANKGKAGQQKQQQNQQAGAKGKNLQQQKGKQPVQQGQGLKARGGIQKAGAGGARPAAKGQAGMRPGQQRPDVRVVPRPGARGPPPERPGMRPRSPPMRPAPRPALRPNRPADYGMMQPRMQQPRYMGPQGGYMGHAPQMMMPMQQRGMMMPAMQMQQPMMQAAPAAVARQEAAVNNDLFDGSVVSSKTSAKLLVSNLDYKVTDEDIKELFGTVGAIKESYIHYDKNGRSVGTATVVFQSRDDALTAFNRYNNVALDNKRMAIEVVEQAVPRGTFKTLSSGINVSRPQAAAAAAAAAGGSYRGRGVPQGDMMME